MKQANWTVYIAIVLCASAALVSPPTATALDGLEQLQSAAQQDQATECMIHEYTRQYNEILRGYSRTRKRLTPELERAAHEKAMQWVNNVWRYADQRTVQGHLHSTEFQRATTGFRASQQSHYPNVGVIP